MTYSYHKMDLVAEQVMSSVAAYGIFRRGWGVGGAGGEQVGGSGRWRRGQRGVRDGGRAADSLGFASTVREIGGAGPSGFVACPTHARTTWCLSRWERGCASWSLGPLWGKPADKQEKVCAATGADARSVALFQIGGIRGRLGLRHCRRTVAQKQQTGAGHKPK